MKDVTRNADLIQFTQFLERLDETVSFYSQYTNVHWKIGNFPFTSNLRFNAYLLSQSGGISKISKRSARDGKIRPLPESCQILSEPTHLINKRLLCSDEFSVEILLAFFPMLAAEHFVQGVYGISHTVDVYRHTENHSNVVSALVRLYFARLVSGVSENLSSLSQLFDDRNQSSFKGQFVWPHLQAHQLFVTPSCFVFSLLHHVDRSSGCHYRRYAGNQSLKIVQNAPEAVRFVATDECQQTLNPFDLVSSANQLSCGLESDQDHTDDERKDADRNPRHRFASAAGIPHFAPASVKPLTAQTVERDRQEGKAA